MLTGMLALQNPLSPGAPALPSTAMTTQKVDGHVHVAKVDNELTSLSWLQKPGVLTSMCTALTGSPHRVSKTGSRSARKPRQPRSFENKGELVRKPKSVNGSRDADKMVNVILNVRNRKYDWEDADKPSISFACMIFMAIESSPTKTLPVKEIYDWIMWKFAFYRGAQPGWKNSVRHNLSLNKCFKKVDRGSKKSKSPLSKGGLWTVDPDYRRSLLAALRRSPYHPYHSYLSPPLSPSSSNSNLESLDPAERDAALTMCMIGGSSDETPGLTPDILYSVYHDHCYAKRPPPVTFKLRTAPRKGLSLAEVAAAAELILRQDQEMEEGKESEGFDSSDEGFGGEESECEEGECEEEEEEEEMEMDTDPRNHSLADSGYSQLDTPPTPLSLDARCSSMEELGADALLCLAGGSKKTTIPSQDMPTEQPS